MKKFYPNILFALAVGLLLASCTPKVPPPPGEDPTLSVSPVTLDFEAAVSEKPISIESNTTWTAVSSDKTWCTLSKEIGSGNGSIAVSVTKNTNLGIRTATVTITVDGLTPKTVEIRQLGEAPAILASVAEPFLEANGGDVALVVTTNIPYAVTTADWLTEKALAPSKAMVTYNHVFTAGKYTGTAAPRFGNIVIAQTGGELKETIQITQLTAAPTDVVDLYIKNESTAPVASVVPDGGVISVLPSAEVKEVTTTDTWIRTITEKAEKVYGFRTKAAPGAITFVVDENKGETRTGYAYIATKAGGIDTLQFKQISSQSKIMSSVDSISFSPTAGEFSFVLTVSENAQLTKENNNQWLQIVAAEGKTDAGLQRIPMTLYCEKNALTTNRTGTIRFGINGSSEAVVIKITQKGYGNKSMFLEEKYVTVGPDETKIYPKITILGGGENITGTVSANWLSMPNPGEPLVIASANTSTEMRMGSVIFKQAGSEASDTLRITQLGTMSDAFNRSTDSLAIRKWFEACEQAFPSYKWPAGANLTQLGAFGIITAAVNGEMRVVVINRTFNVIDPTKFITLPEEFWNLSQLTNISISGPVKGTISSKIYNLKKLLNLKFQNAYIGGDIPTTIGRLPLIQEINITTSQTNKQSFPFFTSVPEEITNLKTLRKLSILLDMPQIPDAICNMVDLKSLSIGCRVPTPGFVPQGISKMRSIQDITIHSTDNPGTGFSFPGELFQIPSLRNASLEVSQPLPATISNSNISSLDIVANHATTLLTSGVRMPSSLVSFSLRAANIREITDEMLSANLQTLTLNVPDTIIMTPLFGKLQFLSQLSYTGAMIEGQGNIPAFVWTNKNIEGLFLREVKGTLSESITAMSKLTHLQITGDVSGYISENQWLFFLNRLGSPLTGNSKVPQSAYRLQLRGNQFTGTIPDFILQSNAWQGNTSPANGNWFPNSTIIDQQPGYGFSNFGNQPMRQPAAQKKSNNPSFYIQKME